MSVGSKLEKQGRRAKLREIIEFLALLSRRDAILANKASAGARGIIHILLENGTRSVAFGRSVVERALQRGWVEETLDGSRIVLAADGRDALRRSKSRITALRAAAVPASKAGGHPLVNPAESPLAWLRRHRDRTGNGLLSETQSEAGERLRRDMTFAGLTPRTTMSWSGIPGEGGSGSALGRDLADSVIAARGRVAAAMRAVGPEHADILIDVCGHLKGLEEIARAEGWPARSARLVLQRALTALARHYGFEREIPAEEHLSRRLRHWGSPDYRPALQTRADADTDGQPD